MSFEALKRDSDKRWLDLTTGSKPWIRVSSAMCCGTSLESDSIVAEIVEYSNKNKTPINPDNKLRMVKKEGKINFILKKDYCSFRFSE